MYNKELPFRVSIGIPVYNEANNIVALLDSIFSEYTPYQTIIVLSGCTDGSEEVVRRYSERYNPVCVYKQDVREGKASAINLFLEKAKGDIVVIINADVVLGEGCLFNMLLPFNDSSIGMVGARPLPLRNANGIVYLMNRIIWDLHHYLNKCGYKKLGEVIGFRNIVGKIPHDICADEVYIEAEIKKRGYKLFYANDAVVYNRCPINIKDLFMQRVRVFWGHLDIKKRFSYKASSMDSRVILISLFKYVSSKVYLILPIMFLCLIELAARLIAVYKYHFVDVFRPYIWETYEK